jgi:formate dehydrogenase major subunit
MQVTRRQFLKLSGSTLAGSSIAALGFSPAPALAEVRQYKLLRSLETRNNCPYCSVGCGILMYSLGDGAKNAERDIVHIEGDPDHPVSRGSLCPKGAGLIDFVHSKDRLKYPQVREPGSNIWKRIPWDEAVSRIAINMKKDRDANFVHASSDGTIVNRWATMGFLAASASSNESGILTQKVTRSLGLVTIDAQSRVCHAPSVSALASSFGRGAMTNSWVDIKNADLVLVMGGNPAEAHPVGFRWVIEAKKRGAKLIVIDPRFNRTASVADRYVPIRAGTDIAFLGGVINWLMTHGKIQWEYVKAYTNAAFIVADGYAFDEGIFSGYNQAAHKYDQESWEYERGEDGYAKTDQTLQNPRCVFQQMKQHYARYTPDMVSNITGTPQPDFLAVCEMLGELSVPHRIGTVLYALGWTQHSVGTQNIRTMAMVQLLLGNIGSPGGGVNALRGHSNIQGLSDLGLASTALPGYLALPNEHQPDLEKYLQQVTPKAAEVGQLNYLSNTPAFVVSLLKWFWGSNATKENQWGYEWLPKWDRMYDVLQMMELMHNGQMNGFVCQGFNILAAAPDKAKTAASLAKLKYLVIIDPLASETSEFWRNFGEDNNVDPANILTEVFRLPSGCFAEEDGSIVNSSRWLQWHWGGAKPPGEAWSDQRIVGSLFLKMRELYTQYGGAVPEPILNLAWPYADPAEPSPAELARESNGQALADVVDPSDPAKVVRKKGEQLDGFAELRDDGSTMCACWVFSGSWTEAGNQMARRDNSDTGFGNTPGWAWAWPANRRILYNRAGLDKAGKPWDPKRALLHWDGAKWAGGDVPDFAIDAPPGSAMMPFIMNYEGVGRLFAARQCVDGPFPEHYEPLESPIGTNPLHPAVISSPAVRMFDYDRARLGTRDEFPYVGTTYRLTEHFMFWTKHSLINAIAQPEQFVEVGQALADEKGIRNGDMVKVSSKRGFIKARAVVTKRIKVLTSAGQKIHQIGIPVHWGYIGATRPGFLANNLPPSVGDCNTQTPEYKAFLVNIEKV